MNRTLYAWEENGKWCLSWFKREQGRPKNTYATQPEIVVEANKRGAQIEWLQ